MNTAKTISVNPVNKTLGALHPEASIRLFDTKVDLSSEVKSGSGKRALQFFFASSAPSINRYGIYMLVFRVMFAALLIGSGVQLLTQTSLSVSTLGINNLYLSIAEIAAGSMLALGLLSRVAMLAMTALFGYLSVMPLIAGGYDMQSMLCFMGSLVFLTMGAGKFSFDFLIRKAILINSVYRRRRQREERMSYRAFRIQNL